MPPSPASAPRRGGGDAEAMVRLALQPARGATCFQCLYIRETGVRR